jgi:hypothetical protein
VIAPNDYIPEVDVIARWPMLTAKELRRARKNELIGFYNFKNGPCYTAEQVQSYIDQTYLKGKPCAARSQQPESQPNRAPLPTKPLKSEGSISTGRTLPEAGSSMPAGMTPDLALSAVAHLGQRIGRRQKLNSLPSSSRLPPRATAKSPALVKS